MYRCGSAYQDRPCAGDQKGRTVGSTGTAAPPATGGGNAECAQRGRDSLKIVWSREGGATEERLLSQATRAEERKLVQDVWRRRGSASQVQAAVEADCLVEVEKRERAAALAIESARAQREAGLVPGSPSASPATPASQYTPDPNAEQRMREEQAARDAERKKTTCARLNSSMDSLRKRELAGGNTAAMERLNDERRKLRNDLSNAGC